MSKKIRIKPGKTGSKIGFFVGIVFILLGLFIAIPTFGLFGIFWTALACIITYTNYKNGYTQEGITSHEIIIYDNLVKDTPQPTSIEDKLIQLESLYNQRLITQEEYEQKRKEILEKF